MLKLADLEKEYLVSCAHCAKPMPAWELFCPDCNQEQRPPKNAGDASRTAGAVDPANGASETTASGVVESLWPQPEDWDSVLPTTAANEEVGFGLGDVRPGAILRDAPDVPSGPGSPVSPVEGEGGARSIDPRRVALGVAATLVVALLIVLMHDTLVLRDEAGNVEMRTAAATVGRVSGTASRDNAGGAGRITDGLIDVHDVRDTQPIDAAATASRETTTEHPVEARAGNDDSTRHAALSAVQALGLAESAALRNPPVAPVEAATAMPVAAMTTMPAMTGLGATGTTDSTDKECTAAQTALALCQAK